MPAFYTHRLVAQETLPLLPPQIQAVVRSRLPLYLFGAQGADFCFFYRSLNPKAKNLGSYLHREGSFAAFQILKALARERAALAYALGYIAHYAADCTFHPYVYATTGNSALRHSRLESLLDFHFLKRYALVGEDGRKLSAEDKDTLFFIYTSLAVKNGFPPLKKSAFLRSIFLFNAYLPLSNTVFNGASERVINVAANAEKRAWAYPAAPEIERDENADELFRNAVTLAAELSSLFFFSVKDGLPLSKALFGKSFLTGI